MSTAQQLRALNWADSLSATLGFVRPPVDLLALARHRRVKYLGLRLMIPRGVLIAVEGGFEVYLRDTIQKDIDISDSETPKLLSARQRFTFAHELTHTLFYKLSSPVPSPDGAIKNPLELEQICDRAAGRILVPTVLLKREIEREVGDCERIDAAFVRSAALKFQTSPEVLIERLRSVEPSNLFDRCILLARRSRNDAVISASYFGMGLVSTLPQPVRHKPLANWFSSFPRSVIDGDERSEWKITRMGRSFSLSKTPWGTSGDFLLQIQGCNAKFPPNRETRLENKLADINAK